MSPLPPGEDEDAGWRRRKRRFSAYPARYICICTSDMRLTNACMAIVKYTEPDRARAIAKTMPSTKMYASTEASY